MNRMQAARDDPASAAADDVKLFTRAFERAKAIAEQRPDGADAPPQVPVHEPLEADRVVAPVRGGNRGAPRAPVLLRFADDAARSAIWLAPGTAAGPMELELDTVVAGAFRRVILASDGLWDVCSHQTAAKVARSSHETPQEAADALLAIAKRAYIKERGLEREGDDASVVVVDLNPGLVPPNRVLAAAHRRRLRDYKIRLYPTGCKSATRRARRAARAGAGPARAGEVADARQARDLGAQRLQARARFLSAHRVVAVRGRRAARPVHEKTSTTAATSASTRRPSTTGRGRQVVHVAEKAEPTAIDIPMTTTALGTFESSPSALFCDAAERRSTQPSSHGDVTAIDLGLEREIAGARRQDELERRRGLHHPGGVEGPGHRAGAGARRGGEEPQAQSERSPRTLALEEPRLLLGLGSRSSRRRSTLRCHAAHRQRQRHGRLVRRPRSAWSRCPRASVMLAALC